MKWFRACARSTYLRVPVRIAKQQLVARVGSVARKGAA